MECALDGQVIQSSDILLRRVPSLFASAAKDNNSGDIILKVVNPGSQPTETTVQLRGAGMLAASAQSTVLTGGNPDDVNSFDAPTKVAPVTSRIEGVGPEFRQTFKPNSLTVLRISPQR